MTGTGIDGVARATGVSTATVSRALRGLPGVSATTRDRVLAAAEELGYVPSSSAAHLASGRTMALGVLLPRIDEWYFAAALEGVDRALRAAGYDLAVFSLGGSGRNRERVFHRSMLRKRIDALLVMCMELTPEELTALQQLDYPSLTVGGYVEGLRNVSIDDAAAAGAAVDHLVSLGHRKIAYLAGGDGHGVHFLGAGAAGGGLPPEPGPPRAAGPAGVDGLRRFPVRRGEGGGGTTAGGAGGTADGGVCFLGRNGLRCAGGRAGTWRAGSGGTVRNRDRRP